MVTILAKGYGLSEEDIIQITDMKRLEYSIALDNILAGLSYDEISLDDIIAGTLSKEPETMLPDETEADVVVSGVGTFVRGLPCHLINRDIF